MSSSLALHRSVVHRKDGRVYLVREGEPARKRPISPEEGVISTAASLLMLASYRNQAVHVFVRPALLATAVHVTQSTRRGEGQTCYVSQPATTSREYMSPCFIVIHCSVHRRALHLLLLPTGRPRQRVHLHPGKVVSGNGLIFQGSASFISG